MSGSAVDKKVRYYIYIDRGLIKPDLAYLTAAALHVRMCDGFTKAITHHDALQRYFTVSLLRIMLHTAVA